MPTEFPDDANGHALRRLHDDGDDLTAPRDIDFTVVLPTKESAETFAGRIRRLGYRTSIEEGGCVPERPWDVVVVNYMLPSHEGITEFEDVLARMASEIGGLNDGWGCVTQKGK